MSKDKINQRLEYLRSQIEAENISYGEIAELQDLASHIQPGDVQLLEWAGVPERSILFETYRKRGRGWQYLGDRYAKTMRGAALMTNHCDNAKVIACRPAGSRDKIYVYRFANVASLTSGQ
jgi:hypothetical protein